MSTGSPSEGPRDGTTDGSGSGGFPRPFGPYSLQKELGRGAQGVVYLAEDDTLHRKVALKVLTSAGAQSQATRDRFRREAELTSRFQHPGICGVYDVGEVEGVPYIAMQFVRGTTLAELIEMARTGATSSDSAITRSSETISIGTGGGDGGLEDVVRLVERTARALHVAHEAGLVHRDVKPANVMVNTEGYPVLLDFGLARDLDENAQVLTQSGQIMGTPAYLAPEQIVASRGPVDRRTDVYALGVTLFECLTLHRPFDATSWESLFHEILDGAPREPREFNPRLPQDLCTIVEVAMDRDPARRYPTAEALAEDLRRVRSFEPIQAKAAGPWTRLRKWARRNPGRATGGVAVAIFVLTALVVVTVRSVQRARALEEHLSGARHALVEADYTRAALEVAQAQELDPESVVVRDLLVEVDRAERAAKREAARREALANAEAARVESLAFRSSYEEARRRIVELEAWLLKERSNVQARFADEVTRAEYHRRQDEVEALEIDAQRLLLLRSEALERAVRLEDPWGGASEATQSAMASFYLERWREALARKDTIEAEAMRSFVERHDPRGEHREELLGRGTLSLTLDPPDAEAWLFRFEPYASARSEPVIPRLVPVPTAGVGRASEAWRADFAPGDPCLVVTAVTPGSPADRAGLRAGDLVLELDDHPTHGTAYLIDAPGSDCLARTTGTPLLVAGDVDGAPIRVPFDWRLRTTRKDGPPPVVNLPGRAAPFPCDVAALRCVDARVLLEEGAPLPLRVAALHAGEALAFEVPTGVPAGVTLETTAYPLILAAANRITPGAPLVVDPGSYLVHARAAGRDPQRFLFVVERRADLRVALTLLPADTTPPGFVHVPSGPFQEGGDPEAFRPREGRLLDLPGFAIARTELSNREWYEFVNDPTTQARIAAAKPGEHLYLPQDDRVLAKVASDGRGHVADVYSATSDASPVLGLAWTDVRDYLVWRNARAEAAGEPWRYALPTEAQWEKAARGVDGREFPWGNRFDPSLAVCLVRQDGYLLDAPGGYEPRDESPFGVLDMAGSREEWLQDQVGDVEPPRYRKRGGHWGSAVEALFRCASRGEASQDRFASSQGVRLVAYRP